MIETASFLLPAYQAKLARARLFIAARGDHDRDVAIVPAALSLAGDRLVVVRYHPDDYTDGDYRAITTLTSAGRSCRFRSGVKIALHFTKSVFDTPDNVHELIALVGNVATDPANADVPGGVRPLDPAACPNTESGVFVTTISLGAALYGVEDRGERYLIADAGAPDVLNYLKHALERASQTDVAGWSADLYRRHLDGR